MTKSGANKWRSRQLREGIRQDEAEIRRYGRLLKLNRRRKSQAKLPKVFKDTGLDYLLDLVDDGGGEDGDADGGRTSRDEEARQAAIIRECPESAAYYAAAADAANAAGRDKPGKKGRKRAKQRRGEEEAEEAGAEQAMATEGACEDGSEDGDPSLEPAASKKPAAAAKAKRPDLYGRDAPDLPAPAMAAAAAAAAADTAADAEAEAALRRRMRALVNRASERVLARIAADLEAVYRESPRGPANRILADLVLGISANSGEPTSDRLLVDQAALIAVVNANVSGSELGAQLAEMLVLRLGTDLEAFSAGLQTNGKASHNLLLFAMFLCWFGVLSARLPFDLLQSLADLATEQSLDALVLCLRHAGLQLRRIDGARMRALLDGLQQRSAADPSLANSGRGAFLLELLQAVRNNNYRKIPGYDCEYAERARKTIRQLSRSEVTPVEFGVSDVRDAETKGRWWVVGAAYDAAASAFSASASVGPADSACEASAASGEGRIAAVAARLGLKTPQRRAIFAALVGAADADDAASRLLRLLSSSPGGTAAADVASIALKCALRESTYNPFYAAVLVRLRRAGRRYAMPIRCAIWDQLASLAEMRHERAARLAELVSELILASALPPAAIMSRFPFELVPTAGAEAADTGGAAAICLCALAGALRRRAADSPELPAVVRGLASDAGMGRALAAALVVAGRQRLCQDAEWLLARLRALADES